jgi:hypothetical protein
MHWHPTTTGTNVIVVSSQRWPGSPCTTRQDEEWSSVSRRPNRIRSTCSTGCVQDAGHWQDTGQGFPRGKVSSPALDQWLGNVGVSVVQFCRVICRRRIRGQYPRSGLERRDQRGTTTLWTTTCTTT